MTPKESMHTASQISKFPTPQGSLQGLSQPYKNKFNRSGIDKQVFLNKELALHPDIIQDPFLFVNNLYRCPKALFNYFMMLSFGCRHMYATQEYIAKKTGMCVRTVQRVTSRFEELGILFTRYRHNTSKQYRFNPYFYQSEVLSVIRSISRGAKFISISMLRPFTRKQENELIWVKNTGVDTKCRTNTNNRFIYTIPYHSHNKPLNARVAKTRMWKAPRPASPIELRETRMHYENNEAMRKNPFGKVVTRIGLLLRLTTAGKVDMVRYPEEALLYAEKFYSISGHKAQDKLKWFHFMCHKYCKEKKLRVDYHYSNKLGEHFGTTDLHDRVEMAPKSNSDKRSHDGECNEMERVNILSLNRSSSLTTQSETNGFKKIKENEDYLDSSSEIPYEILEQTAPIRQQSNERKARSDNMEYSPVSGTHYIPKHATPNRIRSSNGPPASQEEVQIHMANIIKMLSGAFRMEPEKEVAPRVRTPEDIQSQLENMLEVIKESNKQKKNLASFTAPQKVRT